MGKGDFERKKWPFRFDSERYPESPYLIENLAVRSVWLIRLFTPIAWISPFFQIKTAGPPRTVTSARAVELYQLASFTATAAVFVAIAATGDIWPVWLALMFLIECLQYQFWAVILRPAVDSNYKIYSATRTLLLTIVQYIQVVIAFAAIYLGWLSSEFGKIPLNWHAALEFSTLTMSTVSFGTIVPARESAAAALAGFQALTGVFFVGTAVATTLSRNRKVDVVP